MTEETRRIRVSGDAGAVAGPIWLIGWLFTVGYCGLTVSKSVLALIIWPYLLGAALRH
jgi:hypothetical protein